MNLLSPAQTVAVYRAKYPDDGLICNDCGLLLATIPASYARSLFMIDENPRCRARFIATYSCAECRWEAQDAAKTKAARTASLVLARAAKGRQEPAESPEQGGT